MKYRLLLILIISFYFLPTHAVRLLIPMDESQKNHLKSYGITYWVLDQGLEVRWLLNHRGGSFLMQHNPELENECIIRGVTFEVIAEIQANALLNEISQPELNQDAISMSKAPKIAVYSPPNKQPWDDAVTLVLTYAEIEYDILYDEEILEGKLSEYDWLHLHHEDFTGQFGKFWRSYQSAPWYQQDVKINNELATQLGFLKVSQMKNIVSREIRNYVLNGGFLFAMCAATDTYDIALSAEGIDICESMFDGDAADPEMNKKLNYDHTFAFKDFILETDPYEYEFSDIDVTQSRSVGAESDFFTLFEFSAKWDPIPTMLCQNHSKIIKGFMGQTTAFRKNLIKSNVLIMGENEAANEARYIHGERGKGFFTFYGGHDPEDYRHLVGDEPTDLNLHPNSPGYRLILNNVLFPAAKKKKRKT
ncbi:MAG: asparagine synthetase B [Mariniphaga sp.]|nr:asparagine synthetase B [Mariniphaga sp.]